MSLDPARLSRGLFLPSSAWICRRVAASLPSLPPPSSIAEDASSSLARWLIACYTGPTIEGTSELVACNVYQATGCNLSKKEIQSIGLPVYNRGGDGGSSVLGRGRGREERRLGWLFRMLRRMI
ncbi:hypothetical protein ZWY2020_028670 [Hordeum vulgare]|nr:hypothetical protein ZWY2020_028670 [Hordeum vulgare]